MFFGRKDELKEMAQAFGTERFESILIYGRRRVGKTELVNQATADLDIPVIRYECKRTTVYQNLVQMSRTVLSAFGEPLKDYVFSDYEEMFDYLFEKSVHEKFVFVIDEFSFLLPSDQSVDSALAVAIDKWKNSSRMKLVVSGSYVQILKEMISAHEHLFGRFTHIISLTPMDYLTCSQFYPEYSDEDKVMMYAAFGGMPYFNSLIDPSVTAQENIINLIVKKDSILEHEINEVILNETGKIAEMNLIINLISKGVTKYSDLVGRLSKDRIKPDYYLSKLIEMEILEKKTPINDRKNRKKTFYVLKDNLMKFYYRYIDENMNMRNVMSARMFYDMKVRNDFEKALIPSVFERITQEYLILANRRGLVDPVFYDIGTYFFDDVANRRNVQLDVVTEDEKGFTSYECKYTNAPVGKRVVEQEEQATIGLGMNIYRLGFVSRNGFSEDVDGKRYRLITLSDMYHSFLP